MEVERISERLLVEPENNSQIPTGTKQRSYLYNGLRYANMSSRCFLNQIKYNQKWLESDLTIDKHFHKTVIFYCIIYDFEANTWNRQSSKQSYFLISNSLFIYSYSFDASNNKNQNLIIHFFLTRTRPVNSEFRLPVLKFLRIFSLKCS